MHNKQGVAELARELSARGVQLVSTEGQLEEMIGCEEARHDRGGARAKAACERDVVLDREPQAVGRMQRLERPHAKVRPVFGHIRPARVDRERLPLADLELQMEAERGGEDVEPRAEVG